MEISPCQTKPVFNQITIMKTITLLFLLLLAYNPNIQAATPGSARIDVSLGKEHISKKEEKKIRRWQKKVEKRIKKIKEKERKSKFGLLGLLVLLGGVLSLIILDALFGLALIASAVLAIIGLFKDEKKALAILVLALPVAFFMVLIIAFVSAYGEG